MKLKRFVPKLEGVVVVGCKAGWKVNGFFADALAEPELKLMPVDPDC